MSSPERPIASSIFGGADEPENFGKFFAKTVPIGGDPEEEDDSISKS